MDPRANPTHSTLPLMHTGCPRDGSALARSVLLQKQPAKELLDSSKASRRTLSPAGRHVETDLHPQPRPRDPRHRICLTDRVWMEALADQATRTPTQGISAGDKGIRKNVSPWQGLNFPPWTRVIASCLSISRLKDTDGGYALPLPKATQVS